MQAVLELILWSGFPIFHQPLFFLCALVCWTCSVKLLSFHIEQLFKFKLRTVQICQHSNLNQRIFFNLNFFFQFMPLSSFDTVEQMTISAVIWVVVVVVRWCEDEELCMASDQTAINMYKSNINLLSCQPLEYGNVNTQAILLFVFVLLASELNILWSDSKKKKDTDTGRNEWMSTNNGCSCICRVCLVATSVRNHNPNLVLLLLSELTFQESISTRMQPHLMWLFNKFAFSISNLTPQTVN